MKTTGSKPPRGLKENVVDVIGPVEDLESYVKADWWRHLFNANYLRTDGDVVCDEAMTHQETGRFLEILAPEPDSYILDLCCGQGRHTLEIARQGYRNVFGLDRSHYLISKARAVNKKQGLTAQFKEGDARRLPYPTDQFDVVCILGNSFGYFESSQDDEAVLAEVRRILKPGGKLLLDLADGTFLRANYEPRSWEWIDKNYFVCRERSLSADAQRLISREVITHTRKGVIADQFYAERLFSSDDIQAMLQRAGFDHVTLRDRLETASQRNQDLGMMAHRMVVVAHADKPWSPRRQRRHDAARDVVVVLGDPRRDDRIKPNAIFDEDDIHTVDALKAALSRLPGYRFSYLDDHHTLVDDLRRLKGKVDYVFNLCDEGFDNEPTRELHIPALLDVLGLPYSGGGPQCLAYCYDKSLVRGLAQEIDVPVPRAFVIKPEDTTFIELGISLPVIVKPNFGDSSFGITQRSVCHDIEALDNAIAEMRGRFGYQQPILVEEFLAGMDISVGLIGNPPDTYEVLPVIEEDYSALPEGLPRICGYEAKWDPASPYAVVTSRAAHLPLETERFLQASCVKLFTRLGCRDYARFDWRLDGNGTPRLLEVNPNPGWCWDGHLARMAELQGLSYAQMLARILAACEGRLGGDAPTAEAPFQEDEAGWAAEVGV